MLLCFHFLCNTHCHIFYSIFYNNNLIRGYPHIPRPSQNKYKKMSINGGHRLNEWFRVIAVLFEGVVTLRTSCFDTDFVSQIKLTKFPLIHCFVWFLKSMQKSGLCSSDLEQITLSVKMTGWKASVQNMWVDMVSVVRGWNVNWLERNLYFIPLGADVVVAVFCQSSENKQSDNQKKFSVAWVD